MTDFTAINDNNVVVFDRLASLASNRHAALPPAGTFFAEKTNSPEIKALSENIIRVQKALFPNDRPTRCVSFTFEDMPDETGEVSVIVTSVIDEITTLDAEMMIAHIVQVCETGDTPLAPNTLIDATNIFHYVERKQMVVAGLGILLGGIVVMLANLIIPML